MRQSIAILAAFAGATIAADTIEFYFPGESEGVDPVATIKTANPSTTIMHLACPSGVDSNDCGWGIGLDYTIISKTHYQASVAADGTYALSFGCDNNVPKTQMVCTVTMSGGNDDGTLASAGPQTVTLAGSQLSFNKATVIQGANLLSGSSQASATPAAAGSAAGSASAKATGLQTAASSPAFGSAASGAQASKTASGSAAPAQHTGAATKFGLEASAMLMFVGAAVVGAL